MKSIIIGLHPPIDDVIAAGLVPILVNFLSYDNEPRHQKEAAWALTCIAAGNEAQVEY